MSDLDTYLNHCYDVLLKTNNLVGQDIENDELCAFATLITRDNNH